jgi:predicted RNA-binding protein with RPS1 domain
MKTFGQIMLGILIFVGISVTLFTCNIISIGEKHVTNSVENAVVSYDEYQDIYATCTKINLDLATLRETPDNDKQFDQFSKASMINAKKQQLSRWVEEYNSKSKHIDKKWWKSSELPHELDVNQFSNYNK